MTLTADPDNYEALPEFNDWIDSQCGELNILGFDPKPSYVLHQLSFGTYEAAIADYEAQREDELKELATTEFPAPIAHYFYRFLYGSENELQHLHFLRDTWEATISILHALVISELRFRQIPLSDPLKFRELLSDSLNDRLVNIERAFDVAANQGIALTASTLIPRTVIGHIRELNQTRNAFSHAAAQSDEQARTHVSECYGDVVDILQELRGLGEVKVLRYLGQENYSTLRHECFDGHAMTKTIKKVELTPRQLADSAPRYFRDDQILVACGGNYFGLRPFLYFYQDPNGHLTKLCIFKKAKGEPPNRKLIYEVVGESREIELDRATFKPELDELRAMFGLGPD